MTTYNGSCHCGRVAFDVQGTLEGVMACNCSICQRKGILMWFVPRESLHLLTPDENASTYTFDRHVAKHRFCPVCGIHPYGEGTDPQGNRMAAINVRCLEGVDLAALPVTEFDGRSA
ncbi:GFA family protein [Stutzerimonas azotifigens]|uniref:GFA family protein n=1 Tax=Stutzerimonas azotifigens TaxID=291995 RepID=UPI0003F7AB80|nr:GFA family protein [Stutzerimonas azotifigens]